MRGTLFPSPAATSSLRPRDYQATAFDRILGEFEAGVPSTLLVLPTGTGKTVTFGLLARHVIDLGGRVLVLAHREELLAQAANTLALIGLDAAIEKADQRARAWGDRECVVASVQTLQGKRLASWAPGHFALIITDEAHHAAAPTYRRIYDHLEPGWHLGVTATADRLDRKNIGQVFRTLAFEYPLGDAIAAGHLSRLQIVRCETKVDLSAIRTTAGDLNSADIEEAIRPHVEELVNATVKEIGVRRTIVFTPDVGSAQATASALESLGIRAAAISGESRDRAAILADFRAGRHQVLVNCNLLTEGFDAPFVEAIVLMRPTKSRSLYCQMVGRGTRLSPGKANCLVVDFAWLTGRHKLVSPAQLFDTSTKKVVDAATADIVAELLVQQHLDLMDAIEIAQEESERRRRLQVVAKRKEVKYRRVAYDPFGRCDMLGLPTDSEPEYALKHRPTDEQRATLERHGIRNADQMSYSRAAIYVGKIRERQARGLATLKMVHALIRHGIDPDRAASMPFGEAGRHLDRFRAARGG